MTTRAALKLAAVGAALFLAGAPASATGSAAGRVGAGLEAGAAERGAAPTGRTARRRCLKPSVEAPRRVRRSAAPRRGRRAGRERRARRPARCSRIRRLAGDPPAAERLAPGALLPPPAPGSGPGGGAGGGTGGPGGEAPAPLARFVSVSAREFSLTLSRPLVGAGSVTIELRNVGEDPHNLVVSPDDGSHAPLASWPETAPDALERGSVSLAAGRYLLWCSLLDHEAQGMRAQLRVE